MRCKGLLAFDPATDLFYKIRSQKLALIKAKLSTYTLITSDFIVVKIMSRFLHYTICDERQLHHILRILYIFQDDHKFRLRIWVPLFHEIRFSEGDKRKRKFIRSPKPQTLLTLQCKNQNKAVSQHRSSINYEGFTCV